MTNYRRHRRPARHRSYDALLGCIGWVAVFGFALFVEPIVDLLFKLF